MTDAFSQALRPQRLRLARCSVWDVQDRRCAY